MNSQEQEKQIELKSLENVDNRRRFIKGAGIATPVVMTLASRSVFGAQCLSQVMSGNMSHVGEGSCTLGKAPIEWKGPASTGTAITQLHQTSSVRTPLTGITEIVNKEVIASYGNTTNQRIRIIVETFERKQTFEWSRTNFNYGALTTTRIVTKINKINAAGDSAALVSEEVTVTNPNPTPITGTTPKNIDLKGVVISQAKFTRGTKWEYTGGDPLTVRITPGIGDGNTLPVAVCSDYTEGTAFGVSTMREVLCTNPDSDDSASVAALLNASYTPKINYVLTVDQVNELIAGTCPIPPGYTNAAAFFKSTW